MNSEHNFVNSISNLLIIVGVTAIIVLGVVARFMVDARYHDCEVTAGELRDVLNTLVWKYTVTPSGPPASVRIDLKVVRGETSEVIACLDKEWKDKQESMDVGIFLNGSSAYIHSGRQQSEGKLPFSTPSTALTLFDLGGTGTREGEGRFLLAEENGLKLKVEFHFE